MKTFKIMVTPAMSGMRLDVALVTAELGLSRRKIRAVIDAGGVYVNGRRIRIASRTVNRGDEIRVEYNEQGLRTLKLARPEFAAADILYDDLDIVAVNKPPGMPAQATKDQSLMHVATCLAAFDKARGASRRPYVLVHRLDKETSGVMLLATTNERATWLTDLFRDRKVGKTYWAVCHGIPAEREFSVRCHLSDIDKKTGDVRPVRSGGRLAVTAFRVLAAHAELQVSLVECRPETGRSHQIRVHLDMSGVPIVGDKRYGVKQRRRYGADEGGSADGPLAALRTSLAELATVHHFLHAARLRLTPAPGHEPLELKAPMPDRMAKFIELAGFGGASGFGGSSGFGGTAKLFEELK
jgi:23S rRNA pseudouridine1911/1915/1917 synthase